MLPKGVTQMSDNPVRPPDLAPRVPDGGRASFVIPADWPEQNGRRVELIQKKHHGGGLDAAEAVEYDRLQSLADDIVDALSPPLMFTPAERAYIDSKAGH